ncbi:GtrA family protein [Nocardioides sp. GCM10028917]|uniref:GtrA family protein n=1 Tax=Nocardioides sp. GCM10028917 TaxID=3273408 RepID=UPI00360B0D82
MELMPDLYRVAVVVPSLHPEPDLVQFADRLFARGFGHVVIVDDGSGPEYRPTFEALARRGCAVLRHESNKGKGRALKTAFAHCEELSDEVDVVVTADSDGQHEVQDIARVAERTYETVALGRSVAVLGVRAFDAADVPRNSRVGNKITSSVVNLLFGRYLSDTQTGLRGFPLNLAIRSSHVQGERFDYEMNVLLWLLSTRTGVDEVPIRTIYHDINNSVSHFRPMVDSARIYSVILRQAARFTAASVLSAVLDLAVYIILLDVVFGEDRLPEQVAAAVIVARIVSSLFNYVVNKWLVFHDDSRPAPSLARYYLLAGVVLICSALGTTALSSVTRGHDVWAKVIVDLALFVVSYLVQKRWVFRDRSLETE